MRTKLTLLSVLGLLVAGGSVAAAPQAQLRLLDPMPLTVRGAGFKPHEHVRVVYQATRVWTRSTTASTAGGFTATFPRVSLDACTAKRLYAVGSLGSRAEARLPRPVCPAP